MSCIGLLSSRVCVYEAFAVDLCLCLLGWRVGWQVATGQSCPARRQLSVGGGH